MWHSILSKGASGRFVGSVNRRVFQITANNNNNNKNNSNHLITWPNFIVFCFYNSLLGPLNSCMSEQQPPPVTNWIRTTIVVHVLQSRC